MYTKFYNLKEKPFSLTPDSAYLYLSRQHEMALTMLTYGVQSSTGVTVISGEVGSGKTTLIRKILDDMEGDITVGLISNAHSKFGELMHWVLSAFGIKTDKKDKVDLYQMFNAFLISEYAKNNKIILIIDEAQNLSIDTLEELRLLCNINFGKHYVLQLILVGQPELLEKMQRHELRQMAQRVSVDFKLKALGYKETKAYISHRFAVAGADVDVEIIDKYAVAAIYYHSGGIPRLINMLCDYAMVYGFAEEQHTIDLSLMLSVIEDKLRGGIFPLLEQENKEQAKVRELVQEEKHIDILPNLSEVEENTIVEL